MKVGFNIPIDDIKFSLEEYEICSMISSGTTYSKVFRFPSSGKEVTVTFGIPRYENGCVLGAKRPNQSKDVRELFVSAEVPVDIDNIPYWHDDVWPRIFGVYVVMQATGYVKYVKDVIVDN